MAVLESQNLLITSRESKRNEVHRGRGRSLGRARAVKSASRGMFYVGTFRSLGPGGFPFLLPAVRGTGE